jgi:hypothetical protein
MHTDEQIDDLLRAAAVRLVDPGHPPKMREARSRALPLGVAILGCAVAGSFVMVGRSRTNQRELVFTASPPTAVAKAPVATSPGVVADRKVAACSESRISELIEKTFLKNGGLRRSDILASRCLEKFVIIDSVASGQWQRDLFIFNGDIWMPSGHVQARPRPFIKGPYSPPVDFVQLQKLFGSDFFDVTDPIWKDVGEVDGFKVLNQVLRKAPGLQGFTLYGRDSQGRTLVQMYGPPPKKGSVTADPNEPGRGDRWGLVSTDGSYRAITENQAFAMKSYKSEPSTFSPKYNLGKPTGTWGRLGFGQPALDG